ncbi:MAG: dihydroorotate dehydrogenase electron transfer subunit [Gemmataceae bacterium]|nr:dihydroorotate dehydrogenase electron transfer subunit [Gemmataceae bacterium]
MIFELPNRMPDFAQLLAPVLENRRLARDTYLIRLEAPPVARAIRPGQFVMLRLPGSTDPLLGRPFALYDTVICLPSTSGRGVGGEGDTVKPPLPNGRGADIDAPGAIDIVYLVVGKLTGLLSQVQSGEKVEVWGPLGNGFPDPVGQAKHVALVAGGIGQTPFLAHIRELLGERGYGGQVARPRAKRVSLYYGVRTADLAAGVEDFRQAGAEVHLASNDGTLGFHGFVTDLFEQHEPPDHVFGCGPEPMLHALAKIAERKGIPCHLSLETPMACGVGICFSCVTPVRTADGWDYKRVCVEGPVFDAATLHWET